MDLKPKGGLIFEECGPLYYTLWSLWPKGGPSDPQTPPPPLRACNMEQGVVNKPDLIVFSSKEGTAFV